MGLIILVRIRVTPVTVNSSPLGSRSILITLKLSPGSSYLPQPLFLSLLGLGPGLVHQLEQLGSYKCIL